MHAVCHMANNKLIGASLSEPHTSGTALRKCVCIRACLRPYTVNFKCAFKYFPKIKRPRALSQLAMLGHCQSAASKTVAETAEVEARTAPYFLFVTVATDRPGINGRLPADRTK